MLLQLHLASTEEAADLHFLLAFVGPEVGLPSRGEARGRSSCPGRLLKAPPLPRSESLHLLAVESNRRVSRLLRGGCASHRDSAPSKLSDLARAEPQQRRGVAVQALEIRPQVQRRRALALGVRVLAQALVQELVLVLAQLAPAQQPHLVPTSLRDSERAAAVRLAPTPVLPVLPVLLVLLVLLVPLVLEEEQPHRTQTVLPQVEEAENQSACL